MLLIRDVFNCKPGQAKELVARFSRTLPSMQTKDGLASCRILVDLVADYWTVVLESEAEDLSQFERHMREFGSRPEVQDAMAGYMDLVQGGHREIFRIV
jgi:hypothetical protein